MTVAAPQRVAIIGAGAVGSYYGARLAEAGHDVRFLLRHDFDAVSARGLRVVSPLGDVHLTRPAVFRESRDIGPVDWVICALKATSLREAATLVAPCMGGSTRILALMNGLGVEERLAEHFGRRAIFGGMAFTCINRGEPGVVHHLDYGSVTVAHLDDDPDELRRATALWAGSKVEVAAAESLLRARWEKLCWNIPFNGLCVSAGGITTADVLADDALRAAARAVMDEVVAAANADLRASGQPAGLDADAVARSMFDRTATMGAYRPSTAIDFAEGRPMEWNAIFGEPLRRARSLGVPTPYLALLTAQLAALNRYLEGGV